MEEEFDLDQFINNFQERQLPAVTDSTEALALATLANLQPIPMEDLPARVTAQSLLTTRDQNVDSFLRNLTETGDRNAVELLDEAEEQQILAEAEDKLAEASPMLCHKYGTVLKALLAHKQQQEFTRTYSQLPKCVVEKVNLCQIYSACFEKWINSEHLSFSTLNRTSLGQLSAKDCYVAHLFSMSCCRRVKGDDSFAISVVGRSSVGKTRVIEHCLQSASFTYASEPGVGRFNVKNRPILLYRDIEVGKLVSGADSSKFKTICRSEMTSVKVHSATITLPPLWVVVSSNQRINSHTFPKKKNPPPESTADEASPPKKFTNAFNWPAEPSTSSSNQPGQLLLPSLYPSQLVEPGKKVERMEESIRAIQNRVLELYVRDRPDLSAAPLPSGVIFQRSHLVVGIYSTILDLMERNQPEDFYSPVLISYLLTGLTDNLKMFQSLWQDEELAQVYRTKIVHLILKYVEDADTQNIYLAKLQGESV